MEVFIILLLIITNGIFAMYEIALVSSRKTKLHEQAEAGKRGARTALTLLEEPEKVLSAIQVGITLIGVFSGAFGGLTLSVDLAEALKNIGVSEAQAQPVAFALVVGVITYLSLIIGELVPKTIALNHAEDIAIFLSPFMKIFSTLAYPVVWVLSRSTRLVLKVFGAEARQESPMTEEELRMVLQKGSESGVIEKEESVMINEIIRFGDKRANALMTPRVDVEWIDMTEPEERILAKALASPHPRLLICEEDIDKIKGVANVKDMLAGYIHSGRLRLADIVFDPLYLPEQARALRVLEMFRVSKKHFGVVVDEYGSTEGIITLHDLTENIMGDLPHDYESEPPEYFRREDGSYLMDGSMMLEDVEDLLNIANLFDDEEARPDIQTLGGLAMYRLNRIPQTGDGFKLSGYVFEVVDMDGHRVDKVLVREAPSESLSQREDALHREI